MCRLLAYFAPSGRLLPSGLLEGFADLAWTGRVGPGEAPGHGDGWGIWAHVADEVVWERRATSLKDDLEDFRRLAHRLEEEPTRVAIAHLRKTSGSVSCVENSQPFVHGPLVFCHNGTVFDSDSLALGRLHPQGGSDSERLFLLLAERIEESGLQAGLREGLEALRDRSWTALNFVLADGESLAVYRSFDESRDLFEARSAYYELHYAQVGGGFVISSQPIEVAGARWRALGNRSLLVLRAGAAQLVEV